MAKVLIQETEEAILEVLTLALELEGFEVMGTLGFDPGFMERIDTFRPHVIILDYRLDGLQASNVCKMIKDAYPFVPILALSCNSNIHLNYDLHGFDDYIRKPFDLDVLYKILRRHILKQESII